MQDLPELILNYLHFCEYREESGKNGNVNLTHTKWLYPSTILPLANFVQENKNSIKYTPPEDKGVANYFSLITDVSNLELSTDAYCPMVRLPNVQSEAQNVLKHVYKLQNHECKCGGENVFKYLIGELVTNIYEHSQFSNAFVMAQRYPDKKFVEICFFDNGITIPGSFKKYGLGFEDFEAIATAINGTSTKGQERGHGLNSSIKLVTRALKGEIAVVSGKGAIYKDQAKILPIKLEPAHILEGTLVAIRIPYSTDDVDLYEYV